MKKLFLCLFALAMALSVFAFTGFNTVNAASSDFTTNTTNGIVYLNAYNGAGGDVVIPDGVQIISASVFKGNTSITSVTIPDSVTEISGGGNLNGKQAFRGCTALKSVVIGSGLKSIPNLTFADCTNLTSVTIGSGVTSIGDYAFQGCSSLTGITISKNITTIGGSVFSGCTSLTDLILEEGLETIGGGWFSGCTGLKGITIPSSVTSIGDGAFSNCTGLISVSMLNAATNIVYDTSQPYIGIKDAFSGCSDSLIFYGYSDTSTAKDYVAAKGTFKYEIAKYKMTGGTITGYYGEDNNLIIPSTINGVSVTGIGEKVFDTCTTLKSVTIGNGVTSIGEKAFLRCESLTSITIPDSVTSIGVSAFSYCSALTSITIPDSVTSIGNDAFFDCTKLASVTIGSGVTDIAVNAFSYCTALTNITIPGTVKSVSGYAFAHCSGLTNVTIGNGVTSIAGGAFFNCGSLTSITIPGTVTSIGNSAFGRCFALTSVTIEDGITSIGNSAFYDCTKLTSLTLGNGVTSIGESAFSNCSALTGVSIPGTVKSIGDYAFAHCAGLTSLTIEEGVTSIGDHTFYECTGLTSITIPKSITFFGSYAFHTCSRLTTIYINTPKATLPNDNYNGSFVFTGCSSVRNVYFVCNVDSTFINRITRKIGSATMTIAEHDWNSSIGKCNSCDSTCSHTAVTDAAVAATCTEAGKTAGSHCSVCGYVFTAQSTVAAKGHTAVTDAAVAATCTEAGKTEGSHCSECGYVFTAQSTVAAKGHTAVTDAAVAATCTEAGKTEGSHCSECGYVIKAQETVQAKGHTPSNTYKGENGQHQMICSECQNPYGDIENCSGGTATCTSKAICTTCNTGYGEYAHTYDNGVCNNEDCHAIEGYSVGDKTLTISTVEQLNEFSNIVNGTHKTYVVDSFIGKTVVLNSDIDLRGCSYTPIGCDVVHSFRGTFDGNNHTITFGSDTQFTTANYQSLFKTVTEGEIKDLTIDGNLVNSGVIVCSVTFVNSMYGGKLSNLTSNVDITVTGSYGANAAGIVYYFYKSDNSNISIISNCINTGNIQSNKTSSQVGGIIGIINSSNDVAIVQGCVNTGNLSGGTVGGIVASMSYGKIFDSYNTGDIKGIGSGSTYGSGGLIGCQPSNSKGITITNCYNTGNVTGTPYIGALIGNDAKGATITNCYYLEGTAENACSGSAATMIGHTVKASSEMKAATFVELLGNAYKEDGICISSINSGYPVLKWQKLSEKKHAEVTDAAIPATCTKTGLTEGSHCSECGYVIKAQQETALSDVHTPSDNYKIENGQHQMICSVCQNPYGDIENCSGGTATCTSQAICATCNNAYGEKLSHTYLKGFCSVCGTACEHSKEINCSVCNGTGKVCNTCKGTGKLTCTRCNGGGSIKTEKCSNCDGIGQVPTNEKDDAGNPLYESCPSCDGGYMYEVCSTCDGMGKIDCSACNGTGKSEASCNACSGTGKTGESTLVKTNAKDSTCTEKGNIAYWTCKDCGLIFSDEAGENEITAEDIIIPAKGHVARNPVQKNEIKATCTTDGSYDSVIYCLVCAAEISREEGIVVPATGHTFKNGKCTSCGEPCVHNWKDGTCTICDKICDHTTGSTCEVCKGNGKIECSACDGNGKCPECKGEGETYGDCGACYGSGSISYSPEFSSTCEECEGTGKNKYNSQICSTCDGNKTCGTCSGEGSVECTSCEGKGNNIESALKKISAKAATCTETGLTEGEYCSECGETTVEQTVVPATGHSFNQGSCTACGEPCVHDWDSVEGECTICNYRCMHDWSNKDGICKICGKQCEHSWCNTECQYCHYVCDHSVYKEGYENDERQHWKVCDTCEEQFKSADHDWDSETGECNTCGYECIHGNWDCTYEPDKDDNDYHWYVCKECGAKYNLGFHQLNSGTCDLCEYQCKHEWSDGYCSECGTTCMHTTWDATTGKCKTCDYGCDHDEYWNNLNGICDNCGYACKHTEVTDDAAVEPTCTETGLTEGKHCSVCEKVLTAQETVPVTRHADTNNDDHCDVCNAQLFIIAGYMYTEDGNEVSGNMTGLNKYFENEEAKLVAPAVSGYNFVGWYTYDKDSVSKHSGDNLCSSRTYGFAVADDTNLVAVYKALGSAEITIDGGSNYTINKAAKTAKDVSSYLLGSQVTIVCNSESFECWTNASGMILSRSKTYTFTVTGKETITAVINEVVNDQATVVFESYYGQVMSRNQYAVDATILTEPGLPYRHGYVALGWDFDGDGTYNAETDTFSAALTRAFASSGKIVKVRPVYEKFTCYYSIYVLNGTGTGTYDFNDRVTVEANEPESGKKFSHWADENGNVLSYNETYQFFVAKDVTLIAVYVDDSADVDAKGMTEIIDMGKDETNNKLMFISMSVVPEGCTIIKAGVIATNDSEVGNSGEGFNVSTAKLVLGDAWTGDAYRYTFTIRMPKGSTCYVRAYLVYMDREGNTHTIYGDMVSQTM